MATTNWAQGPEWDEFVAFQREHTIGAMLDSAYVLSLVPATSDEVDLKFAVELGMAIMLDKPIIAAVQPGAKVPPGVAKVARAVIVADIDTARGRDAFAAAVKAVLNDMPSP